ncbi:MAG: winged helix-turn-helix transcriptional regulator [Candidatus Accumulibacter sp.]|nr:winged helix-turn-helix transcriptional regulator [Accumulibacter sp.]
MGARHRAHAANLPGGGPALASVASGVDRSVGDVPVCTRAGHDATEAGRNAGRNPVETRVKTPEKILAALKARPDLTLAGLASSIGKSLSAVERATARLVREEKLRFVGPKKGGHWEVLE